MNVNGFELANDEKVHRAIHGSMGKDGKLVGGVGEKATPEAVLAQYDRLGGLITKGGRTVKTGCFFNLEKKVAHETPEVIFVFRNLEGEQVEIKEGEDVPLEVVAATALKARRGKKK